MTTPTTVPVETLLWIIHDLLQELGTELELQSNEEIRLLKNTETLERIVHAAETLRQAGGTVPSVVDSLLLNVHGAD